MVRSTELAEAAVAGGRDRLGDHLWVDGRIAPPKALRIIKDLGGWPATARLELGTNSSTLATGPAVDARPLRIMLASTAKASPPTTPSFMQRATTVSTKSLRRRSRLWAAAAVAVLRKTSRMIRDVAIVSPNRQNQFTARLRWTSSHSRRSERIAEVCSRRSASGSSVREINRGTPGLQK